MLLFLPTATTVVLCYAFSVTEETGQMTLNERESNAA